MDNKLKKKLNDHYQKGQGSIQDLARVYNVSVDDVLMAIGQGHIAEGVTLVGDLVDQAYAGPEVKVNQDGTKVKQTFTVD